MFKTPPLLLVLFTHSCFDPPFFSLGCSARGTIKLVMWSRGGEGWAGAKGRSSVRNKHSTCGWSLLGKGQGKGMGKKDKISPRPRVPLCLNKLLWFLKKKKSLKEGRVWWRELEGESVNSAAPAWWSGSLRWGGIAVHPAQAPRWRFPT